ncbi:MAG: transporter substrate-binding domain-containing protein [Vicingaceae bacterium]
MIRPIKSSLVFSAGVLMLLFSCKDKTDEKNVSTTGSKAYDLIEVKSAGKLRALVDNSSTSYFVYKGTPMGFEYELLSRFASAINVELAVEPIKDLDNIIDSLLVYKGDVIAANLTVTRDRTQNVSFTKPLILSKQVLVQRYPKSNDEATSLVESPSELEGKEVYVRKNSSFYNRLQNLSEEIGGEIILKEVASNITVEQLIKKVAKGEIDYTIADEHVAKINKAFFPNIHIKTAVSLEQQIAWAVRKESPDLLIALNEWLRNFKKTTDYRVIYLKYFGNTTLYRTRVRSQLFTSKSGQLSPYDQIVKKYAKETGWDWRLLTSIIYQESQFNHNAVSWTGAQGLMQLMPTTAAEYGLDSSAGPQQNISAGIEYLEWIDKQFQEKVSDTEERRKFVLAAYNVGLGHVFDAIRLAEKNGLKKTVWDKNVAEMLLNKSKPKYYEDEVVYYGYCRGSEPYKYVNEILSRYEHYKNMTEQLSEL